MTDEINEEILNILQKMARRIDTLEKIIFDENNILMKSGLVTARTPAPAIVINNTGIPDGADIHKMEWDELNELAKRITGE